LSPTEWLGVYSRKRIIHQWTQLALLSRVECRRVLEVGPGLGLATAMLANAGYEVETLDHVPPRFAHPRVPHIVQDLAELSGEAIAGYDAILCCETLEHLAWDKVPAALQAFRASGARHLIVSVPYAAFQLTLDLYLNARKFEHYFSLKKLSGRRRFVAQPAGGHQWEVGYRDFPLRAWEARLCDNGWSIVARAFTGHTRSVFHLLRSAIFAVFACIDFGSMWVCCG
ncbi:MAG TPA: class I SAM-dependent methyltransferase, partial [Stellaceae bacterium]|nr:class I SAM-dependent methyltransferase [Stellaceae bacterium]